MGVFIAAPQRSDNFYLAEVIRKREMGVVVASEPSESEIRTAIEDVHQNIDKYRNNVKTLRENLSENSVERLEAIVDWLINQKRTIAFDFEESNVISLQNSLLTLAATGAVILIVPIAIIVKTVRLICGSRKSKEK